LHPQIFPPANVFFTEVFGWAFEDYGPDDTAFSHAGLDGGFYSAERKARFESGSSLIVFYSETLEATQQKN